MEASLPSSGSEVKEKGDRNRKNNLTPRLVFKIRKA